MTDKPGNHRHWLLLIWRIVVVVAILAGGLMLMRHLKSQKKPPAETVGEASVPLVEVVTLRKRLQPVVLSGFGVVRAGRLASLAPEVSGRVVWRAELEVGDYVAADSPLLRIDARDHELALAVSKAQRMVLDAEIRQWRAQLASTKVVIEQRRQRAEFSKAEATRLETLWNGQKIGTQSALDAAKRLALTDLEAVAASQEILTVTPHRIAAAEANLSRIDEEMKLIELRVERCEIRSPFAGRIEQFAAELGAYAAPGVSVVTISDDRDREVPVALRADEVSQFLPFASERVGTEDGGWYAQPDGVEVEIFDPAVRGESAVWSGTVDRVSRVDSASRMVELVVRPHAGGVRPLPAGTFCEVRIPGKPREAFRIPRVALRAGGKVFVAAEGRLELRSVEVAHADGDWLLVDGDMTDGDSLILGRLMAPVSGMAIQIRANDSLPASPEEAP